MSQLRPRNSQSDLENLLILASIAKTLIVSGPRKLDTNTVPHLLSDNLVLQILKRPSIDPSKKIDFFKWCSLNSSSSDGHCYKHSASAYSDIFRTACRGGYLDQIPVLIDSMKEDGVVVDSGTFKFLLDAFIQSGKFDSAIDILDHMEELGTSLNSSVYSSVLVALVRQNQLGLALSIVLKLLETSNGNGEVVNGETSAMLPDALACNELLVALRKTDMRLEFKSVFDKLREKHGFEFDTWGYNVCIHAFGRWGHVDTSMMLFNEMKEKSKSSGSVSVDPDLCTYNSLIHILCLVGKAKDAIIVWEELKASGHEPDPFTYRTIIQGCCKSYQMDYATKIFSEMQYNGFCPDTVVYNSLLDGLFKARKIIEACQLFEKMVQDGVRASCWTHNIIIDGLFKNGRSVAGYTLFCDLKKKGQFVDSVTYSIVVLHLCKDGQLEEALRLVEEMEGRGLVVDLVTVTSLLIGIHKQSRWDWTERLMKHIRDGFLVPSVLKWKADMETSLKNTKSRRKDFTPMFPSKGDLSEITSFISHADSNTEGNLSPEDGETEDTDPWSSSPYMDQLANKLTSINHSHKQFSLARGKRVQANGTGSFDIDMVNTYLSIFLAKGKISIACKLFEIFTDMGVNPVSYTYNSMMSSFVKKGYFNEAWGVLHEMGENICTADIATYNVIIQGLGKMGKADLASAVLDKLTKHGGYLDILMYNTLINALGKDGRVDEANKLFKQMKDTGINPDVVTYNTLIETHSKAGRLKDAYKFLKMMLDAGCSPNHVTDTTLDFLGKEIEALRYQKASIVRGNKGNGNR